MIEPEAMEALMGVLEVASTRTGSLVAAGFGIGLIAGWTFFQRSTAKVIVERVDDYKAQQLAFEKRHDEQLDKYEKRIASLEKKLQESEARITNLHERLLENARLRHDRVLEQTRGNRNTTLNEEREA